MSVLIGIGLFICPTSGSSRIIHVFATAVQLDQIYTLVVVMALCLPIACICLFVGGNG